MGMTEDSLTILYYKLFNEDLNKWLVHIIECAVPKKVLLKKYEIGLYYKEFEPINEIAETEKRRLTETARSTGIKFTNKTLIEACKIIYYLQKIGKKG